MQAPLLWGLLKELFRCPSPCRLLDGAYIKYAVVEMVDQHVVRSFGQEGLVCVDSVSSEQSLARFRSVLLDVFQEALCSFFVSGSRGNGSSSEARKCVVFRAPLIHLIQPGLVMVNYGFVTRLVEEIEVVIGYEAGNREDRLGVGVQAGHLVTGADQQMAVRVTQFDIPRSRSRPAARGRLVRASLCKKEQYCRSEKIDQVEVVMGSARRYLKAGAVAQRARAATLRRVGTRARGRHLSRPRSRSALPHHPNTPEAATPINTPVLNVTALAHMLPARITS